MISISTKIEIAASASRVWEVLTDFMSYPSWNPFVRSIAGSQTPGATLNVTVQPEGGRAMSFKPRVIVCKAPAELRWKGQVLFPGLFDGEHFFVLSALGPDSVLLTHGEIFSGLLVPLVFHGTIRQGTERGFEAMNRALKIRAEGRSAA